MGKLQQKATYGPMEFLCGRCFNLDKSHTLDVSKVYVLLYRLYCHTLACTSEQYGIPLQAMITVFWNPNYHRARVYKNHNTALNIFSHLSEPAGTKTQLKDPLLQKLRNISVRIPSFQRLTKQMMLQPKPPCPFQRNMKSWDEITILYNVQTHIICQCL